MARLGSIAYVSAKPRVRDRVSVSVRVSVRFPLLPGVRPGVRETHIERWRASTALGLRFY